MHSVETAAGIHRPRPATDAQRLRPIPGILLALSAWLLAIPDSHAAPRKASAKKPSVERPVPRAVPETVYVAVAPAPVRESRTAESAAARRRESAFAAGPARDYAHAFGMYAGFYAAEVLGSNPYANVFWDLYPKGQAFFFEFTTGIGTVQSGFSESVVGGDVFPNNYMLAFEALGGYSYSGLTRGDGRSGGLFPYFVAGITAVYQGGIPNIGGVLGFGNRMILPFGPANGRWALNYGLRDHIYSQKIRTDPSLTQNFVLLIGVQKYY